MTRAIVLVGLLVPALALAGKKDKPVEVDPAHANHFRPVAPAGTDVKYGIDDAWARDGEAKVKVTVVNDTADYVLFKTEEVRITVGGTEYVPKSGLRGDHVVIDPRSSDFRVLSINGAGMHQDSMTVAVNGAYLIPKNAPVQLAPDFRLALENSDLKAGNFSCTVPKKIKQETDETSLRFKCQYDGGAVGLVDPKQIQVRLEDGQLFANDDRNMKPTIVLPGDSFSVDAAFHVSAKIVDMQFATLYLVFNETFREGQARALEAPQVKLELDPAMTAAKND